MSATGSGASRINAESKQKIEAVGAEFGITPGEYLKRVIEDHLDQNPYEIRVLTSSNEPFSDFIDDISNGLE